MVFLTESNQSHFLQEKKGKSGKSPRIKCECRIITGTGLLVSTRRGYGAYSEFNFAKNVLLAQVGK